MPVCFMIMPYGRRPSQVEAGRGPAEIDFNALWDRGYVPVIQELGYEPVRADQDSGSLIISEMLERLYFADLVLADMTIPNGNVYYEIGIRHAAKRSGCALLAADWSKPLFDVAQMRTVRYPLPEGDITPATADAFKAAVKEEIRNRCKGISPMHQAIPGYPDPARIDETKASTTKSQLRELATFQTKVRAVRAAPESQRLQKARELIAGESDRPSTYPKALALVMLLRDVVDQTVDWQVVLDFLKTLPQDFADEPEMQENLAFAHAQLGNDAEAIAGLGQMIDSLGPSPERCGLLGGRYKRRFAATRSAPDLAKAIQYYEQGMDLDLNAYYCSSNLPRLYRKRAGAGDEERARKTLTLVIAACERAIRLNVADEWVRQTLLGAAFDLGDADKAEELARAVLEEGAAKWKVKSSLLDLNASLSQVSDDAKRERLSGVIDRIKPP